MNQILVYQIIVLLIISVLSAVFAGVDGFWSSVAGGVCYLVPSSIAVLLLKFSKRNPLYHGKAFIIGEILKVVLSLVMMLAVFAVWHQSLIFLSVLVRIARCQSISFFLVLLRVKHYGR